MAQSLMIPSPGHNCWLYRSDCLAHSSPERSHPAIATQRARVRPIGGKVPGAEAQLRADRGSMAAMPPAYTERPVLHFGAVSASMVASGRSQVGHCPEPPLCSQRANAVSTLATHN